MLSLTNKSPFSLPKYKHCRREDGKHIKGSWYPESLLHRIFQGLSVGIIEHVISYMVKYVASTAVVKFQRFDHLSVIFRPCRVEANDNMLEN